MHELPRLAVTVTLFFVLSFIIFLGILLGASPSQREFSLLDAAIGFQSVDGQLCNAVCLTTSYVISLAVIFLVLISMMVLEYRFNKSRERPKRLVRYNGSLAEIEPQLKAKYRAIWGGYLVLVGYLGALSFTVMLTEVTKNAVGFPRPDFLWECDVFEYQSWHAANSSAERALTEYQLRLDEGDLWYVTSDFVAECGDDQIKSFVSGHSSSTFCSALYLFLFFFLNVRPKLGHFLTSKKRRIRNWGIALRAVAAVLGFANIALAGWVTFSRVIDARHSPADVTGGALLGLVGGLVGYLVAFGGAIKSKD